MSSVHYCIGPSFLARNVYAADHQWNQRLLVKLADSDVNTKKAENEALTFMQRAGNKGVTHLVYFKDQFVSGGVFALPSALLNLVWRVIYAATAGLAFLRTTGADAPRQRLWESWVDTKNVLANLIVGLTGTLCPSLAIKLENKLKAEKTA